MPARTAALTIAVSAALVSGCGSAPSSNDDSAAPSRTTPASTPASGGGAPVESVTVDIKSFEYKPVTVTVKKGGRVRWTNSDSAAHTSTADDRSFDTQTIERGKTRTVTMTTAGTFHYHCDFHPFMKATVVVK